VYPPTLNDDPIAKVTNIDQSILFDLFKLERKSRANGTLDHAEEFNSQRIEEIIASIEDFDQEEPDSEREDGKYDELPDLSEYEDMIEWEDLTDEADLTEQERQYFNGTKDLDINET